MKNLTNLFLYQIGWWATVYLVDAGSALIAFFVLIGLSLVHLIFFSLKGESEFVLKASLMGYLSDTIMHTTGFLSLRPEVDNFPPPWLFGIWLLLACTLSHSLRWVLEKKWSGVLAASVTGPLTYFLVAQNYSFISYPSEPWPSLLLQALQWGVLVMLFSRLYPKGAPMISLKHRHVLLTGASRGIGLALAHELATRKVTLHLVGRSITSEHIQELKSAGAQDVKIYRNDLSRPEEITQLVEELKQYPIDVLINNAGQLTGGLLEEQSVDAIEQMLNLNVNALIRLTRLLLPSMLERKQGVILNNASVSAKMFFPCASTYAASKAAVAAFTHSLTSELRGTGVSAHVMITPGVKTKMFDDIADLYGGHLDLSFMSSIPAGQWAKKVIAQVEQGKDVIWPEGSTYLGVKFAHYFPVLFEKMVATKFKR